MEQMESWHPKQKKKKLLLKNKHTDNRMPGSFNGLKEVCLKDAAAKAEYETIMRVLKEVNFNKTKAAQVLNVDRKTLYNKIRSYKGNEMVTPRSGNGIT